MTKNVLRLLAIVLLVSLLTPAATLAQFELEVVQAPKDYRDGSLTSLRPIRAADAEVIFVNGIDTEATEHKDGLIRVSNVFPDLDVIGIYNATDGKIPDIGQGLDDLRQALGVTRIGPINPAVEKLLSYLLLYDHEVTIVAHSQGAAITSAALMQFAMNYRERAERLHRVNVITLGGFAVSFPEGPQYLHMVFSSDPVPLFAESFCREERSDLAYRNYQQARYIVNDGPAPDPTNIPDFHCRFFEEVAVPHEHWQHGLGAYLNALPTSAIQSLLAPQPEVTILKGHAGRVFSVAWSPDGGRLASASRDGTVRVWDAGTGALLRALDTGVVYSVAWSPDGRLLASGGDDGTVRVWDAGTGALLRTLWGHTGLVWSVAWSPDGRQLASGGHDHTVRVWGAGTGAALRALEGHTDMVTRVAWSPDGRQLASGSHDHTVRVWEVGTGAALRALHMFVYSVAWSPDGRLLASGGPGGMVWVWEAGTGVALDVQEGPLAGVGSVAWLPDGRLLAAGDWGSTVWVWDAATGATLAVLDGQTEGTLAVAWSPDGEWLATTGFHGTVRLWNVPGS